MFFEMLVYIFGFYLITFTYNLQFIGLIIIISHLYKNITNMKTWPIWTEFIGIFISFILIKEGLKLKDLYIIFIGILKLYAHIRQIIKRDNKYYIY